MLTQFAIYTAFYCLSGFDNDGHKPWQPQTMTMTATNMFSERRYDREFAVNLTIS